MHPARWNVVIRICLSLLLAVAPIVWFATKEPPAVVRERAMPMEKSYLPAERDVKSLHGAVADLTRNGIAVEQVALSQADLGLLSCPEYAPVQDFAAPDPAMAGVEAGPQADVSLLFMSAGNRMAMIDGRLYAEGWRLPDGRRVERISRRGVLLSGPSGASFVSWQAPMRVELVRQAPSTMESSEPEQPEAQGMPAEGALQTGAVPPAGDQPQ